MEGQRERRNPTAQAESAHVQVLVVVIIENRRVARVLDEALLRRARDKVAVGPARDAPVDLPVDDPRLRGGEEVLLAGEGVEERVEPGGDEPAGLGFYDLDEARAVSRRLAGCVLDISIIIIIILNISIFFFLRRCDRGRSRHAPAPLEGAEVELGVEGVGAGDRVGGLVDALGDALLVRDHALVEDLFCCGCGGWVGGM